MVLVFSGIGMFFMSYVYRYNLLYVFDSGLDTKGLFYPRALLQLMVGLYIAEFCLIGLFALKSAFVPLLMMVVFLVFTGLVHISLNESVTPLLNGLPQTLALEKDIGMIAEDERPGDDTTRQRPEPVGGLAADYYNLSDDEDFPDDQTNHDLDTDIQLRGIEGSSSLKYHVTEWTKTALKNLIRSAVKPKRDDTLKPTASRPPENESALTRILTQIKISITPDASRKPNFLLTFLHPEIYQDFRTLQPMVNPLPDNVKLPADYARRAYWAPEMWVPGPRLWIPRDEARVSRQEVAHSAASVGLASDRGCWLVEGKRGKFRIECEFEGSPLHEERPVY